jgi:hypothetical protein
MLIHDQALSTSRALGMNVFIKKTEDIEHAGL